MSYVFTLTKCLRNCKANVNSKGLGMRCNQWGVYLGQTVLEHDHYGMSA